MQCLQILVTSYQSSLMATHILRKSAWREESLLKTGSRHLKDTGVILRLLLNKHVRIKKNK